MRVATMALFASIALAATTATAETEDEKADVAPQPRTEVRWYGWQTLLADTASLGLAFRVGDTPGCRERGLGATLCRLGYTGDIAMFGAITAAVLDASLLAYEPARKSRSVSIAPAVVVDRSRAALVLGGRF